MSDGKEDEAGVSFCASCGKAEIDDIKLMPCDDCDLVRYCSGECQRDHKSEHEKACKKRAAELRDELLFKQPEGNHMGDCPICSLPLSFNRSTSGLWTCCSKIICLGCRHANELREFQARRQRKCPFCRHPVPTYKEADKLRMKRAKANDPVAIYSEGAGHYSKGHYSRAFECWTKAAELGDVEAHFKLAMLYHDGEGTEKDEGKLIYHLEEAAIGGHPMARYNLGAQEYCNANDERAVKHWIIAAGQGLDESIKALMDAFEGGFVSKEDLAAALRAQKAAIDEMKSAQRVEAEEFYRRNNIR